MISSVAKNGHIFKQADENTVLYYRYGLYSGEPFQEVMIFVRAGTNSSEPNDPRRLKLPDVDGWWLLGYGENVLGQPELIEEGWHPLELPLAENAELCSEVEYFEQRKKVKNFSDLAFRSARRLRAINKTNRDHKAAILKGLGLVNNDIDMLLS